MSQLHDSLDEIDDTVNQIVKIAKTETASVFVYYRAANHEHKSLRRTLSTSHSGEVIASDVEEDKLLFCTASLTKVFIAAAACLWIDDENWERSFTAVFNLYRNGDEALKLPGKPTIPELLVYFNGIHGMNHLILAPDGNPLLSRQELLETIQQYSKRTHEKVNSDADWLDYSNANYILVAMVIERISGMSFWNALKAKLFDPLGMQRTFMNNEDLDQHRAQPHVVSSDGQRRPITYGPHLKDIVEMVVFGAWTCTSDVGIFFKALVDALDQKPNHPIFGQRFLNRFFGSLAYNEDGLNQGYMPAGLKISRFDTILPGSHSLNRRLSPQGDAAKYVLGKMVDGSQLEALYNAGSATGWACTAYLLHRRRAFVVVLTNTSGPLDSSDFIARVYLQKLFDLQPAQVREMNASEIGVPLPHKNTDGHCMTHLIRVARQMFDENSLQISRLENEAALQDTSTATDGDMCGKYQHEYSGQCLFILNHQGTLRVIMTGVWTSSQGPEIIMDKHMTRVTPGNGTKASQLMRFVRLTTASDEELFRICALRQTDLPGFAIDCFADWLNRDFIVTRDKKGIVRCLSRKGVHDTDYFLRQGP